MTIQPGHRPPPTATPAGQPTIDDNARKFLADLESAYAAERAQQPTAIRITDPTIPSWQDGPRIGTTPPVTDQPGTRRPPMGQKAVDASTLMLSGSVAYAIVAGSTSVALWATHFADPKVIALLCAAPPALAVPILATCAFLKRAKEVVEAAPPTINNHYSGTVYQDRRQTHVNTKTVGVIAVTRNQPPALPPAN